MPCRSRRGAGLSRSFPRSAGGLRRRLRVAVLLAAALAVPVAACDQRTALVEPGSTRDTTDAGGDGTLQKATLSVAAVVSGEDSAIAARIGLGSGVLPGAEVTLRRTGSNAAEQTARTDSLGRVVFEDLLPGRYEISALRILSPQEAARLAPEDADVDAFGGGTAVRVEPPRTEATLRAAAGRRGSLVISELSVPIARLPSGEDYRFGGFIEVYNNSDTTIYLDGKVIVRGQIFGARDSERFPCDVMARWQQDPAGIWTRTIEAFPGRGRDFPLEPGQAAVVATDAIDHRQFHPDLRDLSRADFEFHGSQDVDNPSVPNMITLGDEFGVPVLMHGLLFDIVDPIVAIAEPVDPDALQTDDLPNVLVPRHWLIPADKILDVLTASLTPEIEANLTFLSPRCPRLVNEKFDRQRADLLDTRALNGIQRRVLAVLPDGRKILQRTRTSARDFVARFPPTPGEVP